VGISSISSTDIACTPFPLSCIIVNESLPLCVSTTEPVYSIGAIGENWTVISWLPFGSIVIVVWLFGRVNLSPLIATDDITSGALPLFVIVILFCGEVPVFTSPNSIHVEDRVIAALIPYPLSDILVGESLALCVSVTVPV
jgi:hypothetical protein